MNPPSDGIEQDQQAYPALPRRTFLKKSAGVALAFTIVDLNPVLAREGINQGQDHMCDKGYVDPDQACAAPNPSGHVEDGHCSPGTAAEGGHDPDARCNANNDPDEACGVLVDAVTDPDESCGGQINTNVDAACEGTQPLPTGGTETKDHAVYPNP